MVAESNDNQWGHVCELYPCIPLDSSVCHAVIFVCLSSPQAFWYTALFPFGLSILQENMGLLLCSLSYQFGLVEYQVVEWVE